jgi:hypothetical protein
MNFFPVYFAIFVLCNICTAKCPRNFCHDFRHVHIKKCVIELVIFCFKTKQVLRLMTKKLNLTAMCASMKRYYSRKTFNIYTSTEFLLWLCTSIQPNASYGHRTCNFLFRNQTSASMPKNETLGLYMFLDKVVVKNAKYLQQYTHCMIDHSTVLYYFHASWSVLCIFRR